ncbi:MAG: hypothetical protein KJ626_02250 [Verrucomicrobia bacterium]|nr:hypothetical protein [Verrucomicrobiota bacterium]
MRSGAGAGLLIASLILLTGQMALGQGGGFTTPLHVGVLESIVDEKGDILFGNPWTQPGDLVQLLKCNTGVILPPSPDGTPNPNNEVIYETAIGCLAPWVEESGIFGMSISGTERPTSGRIFVRVFNNPTASAACFYGDSQTFDIDGNKEFIVELDATDIPLHTGDPDNDGLIDSWEMSYGSDTSNPDTDEDGMIDGHEVRAHTDLLDPDSLLQVARIRRGSGTDAIVSWDAVSGVVYQVEATIGNPGDHASYSNVGSQVAASGSESEVTVSGGLSGPTRTYRVRLVEE